MLSPLEAGQRQLRALPVRPALLLSLGYFPRARLLRGISIRVAARASNLLRATLVARRPIGFSAAPARCPIVVVPIRDSLAWLLDLAVLLGRLLVSFFDLGDARCVLPSERRLQLELVGLRLDAPEWPSPRPFLARS